jgi:hypothetical protein
MPLKRHAADQGARSGKSRAVSNSAVEEISEDAAIDAAELRDVQGGAPPPSQELVEQDLEQLWQQYMFTKAMLDTAVFPAAGG